MPGAARWMCARDTVQEKCARWGKIGQQIFKEKTEKEKILGALVRLYRKDGFLRHS
jgi:hypothetical protein